MTRPAPSAVRSRRPVLLVTLLASTALLATACTSAPGPAPSSAAPTAPPTASSAPPTAEPIVLPTGPTVYFFGDSWTHGTSAAPGKGFPAVLGRTLSWTVRLGPDNSGAGFVHTYEPKHALLPDVAEGLGPITADLIVLEGGLNDGPGPLTELWTGVTRTVTALRARSGDAPIVLVGPASPDGLVPEGLAAIDSQESAVARQLGLHYISPIQERWFTPANVGDLVDPVTRHPNTVGHAYYAARLAADLAPIVTTRAAASTPTPT